jgi:hypothetical protein
MTIKATIYEQGNGLPDVDHYCAGEGRLWRLESIDSRILTGDPRGNYMFATVSEVDWSDCSEGDEHTARVVIDPCPVCPEFPDDGDRVHTPDGVEIRR